MSYPLVCMSRSIASHRLNNDLFALALRRKLRLPIHPPNNCPTCWCGKIHDCYGDHAFTCVSNHKGMAHDIIKRGSVAILKRLLVSAKLLLPASAVTEEKKNLVPACPGLRPLDVSFSPDPNLDDPTVPQCPYSDIGVDYTITGPQVSSSSSHTDVPSQVTAIAELHLQKKERGKLLRPGKADLYMQMSLTGKDVIRSLNDKGIVLIPAAIDPHGKWGPMFDSLLTGYRAITPHIFNQKNQAAATMPERATSHTCPTGIIQQATKHWRATKPNTFYGGSYSAPTPHEWFLQEIGLLVTKAFSIHLRRSGTRVGLNTYRQNLRTTRPPRTPAQTRAPPGFTMENSGLLTFSYTRANSPLSPNGTTV